MVLLDTHAFIWLASDQSFLTEYSKRIITEHSNQLSISSISALEIALLVKRKQLILPLDTSEYISKALNQHGIVELVVDIKIFLYSASLPDIHNDPFDRIIISTAILNNMLLITKDKMINKYPDVKVVWE